MNNKGLTLVEIIAVLIILSVIAVIVTPNVMSNIAKYREKMYQAQIANITDGAKNWVADNIDLVPTDGTAIALSIEELQTDGYIDDNIKNPKGENFDDFFSIIYVKKIVDETGKLEPNYKYTYGTYENIIEYEKDMALDYKKTYTYSNEVTTTLLQSLEYLPDEIKKLDGTTVSMPIKTIKFSSSTNEEDEVVYTAYIDE